jgi:YegS/Rv2252/BmrU family lipid kinase
MSDYAKVIVNPAAGARKTYRRWPEIQNYLRQGGLSFDYVMTEGSGHATSLAREAASDGCRFLVAVGGDGTVNEVVNGLLTSKNPSITTLGIVSTGTGNDLIRSLGIPHDCAGACKRLSGGGRMWIDVGLIEFTGKNGPERRYFVNAAGVGFDGEVAENVEKMPKNIGHTVPFVMGLLRTLPAYRNKNIKLTIDSQSSECRVLSVIVSNGAFFGGGMKVAPAALPADRKLDVVTVGDIGKLELLRVFPRIYKGTHVTHRLVRTEKAEAILIESRERMLVQADGELLGESPVRFSIHPGALCLAV